MIEEIYIIEGMSCAACSAAVERVTRKLEGVESSNVNLTTNRMTIYYDESKVTSELIMSKVEKAGFGIKLYEDAKKYNNNQINEDESREMQVTLADASVYDREEENLRNHKKNLVSASAFTIVLLYISMGPMLIEALPFPDIIDMHKYPGNYALTQLLLTIPILWFGRKFFINGFKALFHMNPNMDTLVAIGSTASFVYSLFMTYLIPIDDHFVHNLYYESAAVVITLIMFGKYLEGMSKVKTKGAIKKLMELAPEVAVLEDGTTVPTKNLKIGDIVLIKPGSKIPIDGVVIRGNSGVDEAMITGESIPVNKSVGDNVIGGSINVNGVLYVKVSKIGEDTTLAKIIRFVEDAQGKKAPISKLADKVAGIFVPAVILIAIASAVVWLIAGKDIAFVLKIFTSVLVIACPCSLGLATPTAIMVGTGLGASNGILIRNGEVLETAHLIDTVVLDKTGTITQGRPSVKEIITDDFDKEELLSIAGAVEKVSEHPLAKAVIDAANMHNAETKAYEYMVLEFENYSGMGIKAKIQKKQNIVCKCEGVVEKDKSIVECNKDIVEYDKNKVTICEALVGNKKLLEKYEIIINEGLNKEAAELEGKGHTLIYVAIDYIVKGIISVADTIKETSKDAIELLKKEGIQVIMLTGDNKGAANAIGKQAGCDEIISEVVPEDKANVIAGLQEAGKKVMMVGDGINDAPALTQADVGCAIGSGSDIAIESGDIVLMKSDLLDVPAAIKLSRMTIKNIKENLFWAFLYNSIGLPVAAGVLYSINGTLLNPMLAGLAMSLSSVCVVSNALRLKTKKIKDIKSNK